MPDDSLTHALSCLPREIKTLNQSTDELRDIVQEVEQILRGMNIGMSTTVPVVEDDVVSDFDLIFEGGSLWVNQNGKLSHWSGLSREAKIDSVEALPRLIDKILEGARSLQLRTRESLITASDVLQKLRNATKETK